MIIRRPNRQRGPKPLVEFEGNQYSLRSYKTEVPDLAAVSRVSALLWLCQNTTPRGYSRPSPLAGYAGAVSVAG